MAPILGLSTPITAGAVISGAYMGDKMSPLSETTVLVPQLVGGVTVNQHIRGMLTDGRAVVRDRSRRDLARHRLSRRCRDDRHLECAPDALAAVYNIGPVNLLPLALLIVLSIRRVPPFLAILGTALFSGVLASVTQPDVVSDFVGKPGQGRFLNGVEAIFSSMATGHVASSTTKPSTTSSRAAAWRACSPRFG